MGVWKARLCGRWSPWAGDEGVRSRAGAWRVADARQPRRRARAHGHAADGVVACVADAGATFLAPIFDELAAVVCLSGTPRSHIGIVSREYQVPASWARRLDAEPADGDGVEVDC